MLLNFVKAAELRKAQGIEPRVDAKLFIEKLKGAVKTASFNQMVQTQVSIPEGHFPELPKVEMGLRKLGYRTQVVQESGHIAYGYYQSPKQYIVVEWSS